MKRFAPSSSKKMYWIVFFILCVGIFMACIHRSKQPPPQLRGWTSRARAELHELSKALEAYYVNNNSYPAWSINPDENLFTRERAKKNRALDRQPTFMVRTDRNGLATLTTPVAYLSGYFTDHFSGTSRHPHSFGYYSYWTPADTQWIAWSPGPDQVYDITIDNVPQIYAPPYNRASLAPYTYDPTNGLMSGGDIWKVKE